MVSAEDAFFCSECETGVGVVLICTKATTVVETLTTLSLAVKRLR